MKNFYLSIIYTALILSFNSCKDKEDIGPWREANLNAYQEITRNSVYREIRTETGPRGVFYKILKAGDGTECPLQTSRVRIYYKLSFIDGTVYDQGSTGNNIPASLDVNGNLYGFMVPRGLSYALQNMVVGDRWEIWVPYYLGYGPGGLAYIDDLSYSYGYYRKNTLIKGYTTLIYDIELVGITQYPK